jgi:excisionase family DNA binding protein
MIYEQDQQSGGNASGERPVEGFIDKVEVAKRLKKKLRTVDNWMRRGLLPYYKIGRSVSFKWSEVEAHLGQTCRVCRSLRKATVTKN